MNGLPGEIFRKWMHSFEEDMGGITVYRPGEFNFPRARGRDGIEFRPDGTFIDLTIGRGDASHGINGRWQEDESGRVRISFGDNVRQSRILEIVQIDANVLKVRQQVES